MSKVILAEQVKDNFTQEQADSMYIQITNGATTTLASSLQVSGINNIEFTEEGEDPITASNVSYSNTTSGMTSGNVQNAIDELFQSVSEGKSLIAAAVTDKGVETAATDSFATMAGNIGQISSGGGGGETVEGTIVSNRYSTTISFVTVNEQGQRILVSDMNVPANESATIYVVKDSIINIWAAVSGAVSGEITRASMADYDNTSDRDIIYYVTGNFSFEGGSGTPEPS